MCPTRLCPRPSTWTRCAALCSLPSLLSLPCHIPRHSPVLSRPSLGPLFRLFLYPTRHISQRSLLTPSAGSQTRRQPSGARPPGLAGRDLQHPRDPRRAGEGLSERRRAGGRVHRDLRARPEAVQVAPRRRDRGPGVCRAGGVQGRVGGTCLFLFRDPVPVRLRADG
ncbi:hypothetical protein VTK73DRAFT_5041 [Phialemonium thermophilum]|uniref:Uncharacterized protein n=1 Tax=Phialemonium thermophilum TaxID=223376 RepID=A0ABR3V452_9PEZI